MPRPIHFEIHAAEPARAIAFYQTLFGWQFQAWAGAPYWLVTTGPDTEPGINGGLVPRRGEADGQAVTAYVCTVGVDDVDAVIAAAARAGGSVALPRMPVPGVGWLAYLKDTEGNLFGVMQDDPDAPAPEGM